MNLLRLLAWPFSLLYGLAVFIRNKLFDFGFIPSTEIDDVAVIGVGNLAVGGTGKTPHVEYLVKLLHPRYSVGTLSRGYGRKTRGFHLATKDATTLEIGDEPKQFRHRFPEEIPVAVDGARVHGVKKLLEKFPKLQVVILDDVFQHRRIKPGLQIMLTDYARLFYQDNLLPTGYLREPISGVRRADIIVVTKTPDFFSPIERKRIIKDIKPQPYQKIYFSKIVYGEFVPFLETAIANAVTKEICFNQNYSVVLLTGIANSHSLEYFLKDKVKELVPYRFRDHHEFMPNDLLHLKELFNAMKGENKIVLTTEKDAMRLQKPELAEYLGDLPIYYVPIEVAFQDQDAIDFNQQINDYVRPHQVNSHIHPRENE
ncbi:MAG: tetraacyldisaccharide 4'-kinase [Bacteroidetes bacterium]|jgi:tetraacyldisaccharide 4'-kinase|nr:tetraacyldisaccharide 4'-kinase [Bacteroidota bacterium]